MPGGEGLGAVRYQLERTAIDAEIVEVPGLTQYWIDGVVDEVYPRSP